MSRHEKVLIFGEYFHNWMISEVFDPELRKHNIAVKVWGMFCSKPSTDGKPMRQLLDLEEKQVFFPYIAKYFVTKHWMFDSLCK